jgi:nucleoid DNA-binding protein
MNKDELIRAIHAKNPQEITLKDVALIVDEMLEIMGEALARGDEVDLEKFGTFALAKSAIEPAVRAVNRRKQ